MAERMRDGIIKRGAGYSYVVREVDPATGKRKQRWISGYPTRAAAKAARDEARHAVHQGTYVAPQDLTVAAWLDRWIDGHCVELKPSTERSYREKIRLYLLPTIGHERLQALSPSRLSVVWRELHLHGGKGGRPVSARTVGFARAVLRKAMQDAVVERLVPVNPVTGSKMPKQNGKPKHTTWTGPQLAGFLAAMAGERWLPMWQTFAATGLRRGEVAGLRWSDVDLDAGVLAVERSTTQLGNERVTTSPKNHNRRTVKIDPTTVTVLRGWKVTQAAEKLAWGVAYDNAEGLVFTWEDGRPAMPDWITKSFDRAQDRANERRLEQGEPPLARLVVHELRHTHLTILLRSGVPVHIVAKRAGHKDPSVTLNVYADAIPDDDTSAVDVFSREVWGA